MKNQYIDAVAFDAYGTLCRVTRPHNPLQLLFQKLGLAGRELGHEVMTLNLNLPELARLYSPNGMIEMDDLQRLLRDELDSVRLYPETVEVLQNLRTKGYRLAVISNVAKPYAKPVRRLLEPYIDEFVWSFEVAAAKPDHAIFATLCQRLKCLPMRVLMVGDSWEADIMGASQFGMPAVLLDRQQGSDPALGGISTLLELTSLPARHALPTQRS